MLVQAVVDGPSKSWSLDAPGMCGRQQGLPVHLDDPRVSRRHAEFVPSSEGWAVRDCSTHGTFLNGVRLHSDVLTPLQTGDRLTVGPFTLQVAGDQRQVPKQTITLTRDRSGSSSTISLSSVPTTRKAVSADRLRTILDCAARLTRMETSEQIAAELIGIMLEMTRFEWGAVVEYATEDRMDRAIVASHNMPQHASVSQSLLRSAKDGTASLMGTPMLRDSHSIIASATTDALAATIRVGDEPVWQLYLATGEGNPAVDTDTPLLVEMLVHITGLVLSDHQRADLEIRQSRLQQDISYAREVQNRIMGSVQHESAGLFTEIRSIPGRGVAGDLVGLRQGPEDQLYCFIGDVSGKGPAAAMLMAATQAYLTSLIDAGAEITDIAMRLNRYIHSVSADNEFVTLWLGCVDQRNAVIKYVDAGHGYAYAKSPGLPLRLLNSAGGLPIGIMPDEIFECGIDPFPEGSILFLCSDGVNEQPNAQGDQFGDGPLRDLLSDTPDATFSDRFLESLRMHAGSRQFHDDVTFALLKT